MGKGTSLKRDLPEVYQLRIRLLQISPMIWRCLLVRSDASIADLHHIIQIAMGWENYHLHQFTIHGGLYGISYEGGVCFESNPKRIQLKDFKFRVNDRFLYEYDFTSNWEHEIRIEKILALDVKKTYPLCIDGKRAAPPEDCGSPWRFMELSEHYSPWYVGSRIVRLVKKLCEEKDPDKDQDEDDFDVDNDYEPYDNIEDALDNLNYWINQDKCDRRQINKWLREYSKHGNYYEIDFEKT